MIASFGVCFGDRSVFICGSVRRVVPPVGSVSEMNEWPIHRDQPVTNPINHSIWFDCPVWFELFWYLQERTKCSIEESDPHVYGAIVASCRTPFFIE